MTPADRAMLIAALIAADPVGLGGVRLRAPAHPQRQQWLEILRNMLPPDAPFRRVPHNISDRQLFGGLDLAATLSSRRLIAESGLLSALHGGVAVMSMAERLSARTASCVCGAMDSGRTDIAREGVWLEQNSQFAVVALDEGIDEEAMPASLFDRLAFAIDFNDLDPRAAFTPQHDSNAVAAAAERMRKVRMSGPLLEAICAASLALGIDSSRAALFAVRTARLIAAFAARVRVEEEDVREAVSLVLSHRAQQIPAPQRAPETTDAETESPPTPPGSSDTAAPESGGEESGNLDDRVIAASEASIPEGLLASLKTGPVRSDRQRQLGRSGAARHSARRGRPIGVRAGNPRSDGRLNIIATLQAAAPWQGLRGIDRTQGSIRIESSDFRVTRYRQRSRSLIVFTVDASGSSALNRLAEAKGAVELILADCYIRRDEVAVIGFRGTAAEVLLPPTRSLVRAKVSLAGLPAGGATPLAPAIVAALDIAKAAVRRGDAPSIVLLTDGRANMGFQGVAGREAGHRDALRAAAQVRGANIPALFIDTSPRPNPAAREIAGAMNARYVPLPWSDSRRILEAVKLRTGERGARA